MTNKNDIKPFNIVDVGCRWGFADKYLNSNAQVQIFGFDPDKEECERLKLKYNDPRVRFFSTALAEKSESKKLYITQEPACSSLYPPDESLINRINVMNCIGLEDTKTIKTSTLDIWSTEEDVNYIDHIKLDTQGADLDVLIGAQSFLGTIKSIEVEVSFNAMYINQALFADVDSFLRNNGFVLWDLKNEVRYNSYDKETSTPNTETRFYDNKSIVSEALGGQLFWADAQYIRKETCDINYRPNNDEIIRDMELFKLLGLLDIVELLKKKL